MPLMCLPFKLLLGNDQAWGKKQLAIRNHVRRRIASLDAMSIFLLHVVSSVEVIFPVTDAV